MNSVTRITLAVAALLAASSGAHAQVRIEVRLPTFQWELPPPRVVIEPGVEVVEDYDEEVYFHDGWYWYRDDLGWYRSRDHRGHWVSMSPRFVPRMLVQIPRGKYRHYRVERRPAAVEMRRDAREERAVDRRPGDVRVERRKGGKGGKERHK